MAKKQLPKRTVVPKRGEVARLRLTRGWSQQQLLEEIDKVSRVITTISPVESKRTLSRIENGNAAYPRSIQAIAHVFGVPVRSLVEEDLSLPDSMSQLDLQPDIDNTYASMWGRLETTKPKRVWATYLNPEAFATGEPPPDLKTYYEKAERLDVGDYRRVFGIYPDRPEYRTKRSLSLQWIRGHVNRTRKLKGYQIRYVELTFQAAEVLLDDFGVNFSFPCARAAEAGWATMDDRIVSIMKDYFQQVWDRASPIEEL
jgi:transcriptional regulator with XRE-family HTH domain